MTKITKKSTFVLTMLLLILAVSARVFPQQEQASAGEVTKEPKTVPRVESEIKIDGVMDEEAWKSALKFEPSVEISPGENTDAPVHTEVFLLYDNSNFYAAFHAYVPDTSAIRARYSDRDKMWSDDWVAIVLDTFSDKRHVYNFVVNPFGVQGDSIESIAGSTNLNWDSIWESKGRIVDDGYIVEIAIPFTSLHIPRKKGAQVWGFDATRSYPRNLPHYIGLFPRPRNYNCYTCLMERISGDFASRKRPKKIEIDPSLSVVDTRERENFTEGKFVKTDSKLYPGVSARWKFTPNMILNATVNPDFSHVEADAAKLDINTRFSLYYPEKRPFFLEGATIFETRMPVVYTRALADPVWGLKVTGKEGPHNIGFYSVQDSITNILIPGSYGNDFTSLDMNTQGSVLRYRLDIGKVSAIGAVITDREGKDYFNRVVGIDSYLRISDRKEARLLLLGSQTRYPGAVAAEFGQSDDTFSGTAMELFFRHTSPRFIYYGIYQQATPDFRADMGFLPQVGYRHLTGGMVYFWYRNPGHWFTVINVFPSFEYEKDFDDNLIYKILKFKVNYTGPSQSDLSIEGRIGKRSLLGEIFDTSQAEVNFSIQPSGPLYLTFNGIYGNEIDYNNVRQGKVLMLSPGFNYKLGKHVSVNFSHIFERFEVDEGRLYTAHVSNMKLIYQFSERAFLRAILQYKNYDFNSENYLFSIDPEYQHFFTQFLFSYKLNPRTMLFLGYSDDNYGYSFVPLTRTNRTLFLKIGYAFML
jgi:hypothetical protein